MEQVNKRKALFWFRRDLRMNDNVGLYNALKECDSVAPIFIFDKTILEELPSQDRRVEFIWQCLNSLKIQFREFGSDIMVRYANAESEVSLLAQKFGVDAVYANEDYEPKARQRDGIIKDQLQEMGIAFKLYKDTVIFSKDDVLNTSGQPFTVFTSYKNNWKKKLNKSHYQSYKVTDFMDKLAQFQSNNIITLEEMGFQKTNLEEMHLEPGTLGAQILFDRFKEKIIPHYKILRDIPFSGGVSYLSLHNRVGTISIRYLVSQVIHLMSIMQDARKESCEIWLDELIWREFYMQLLYHFPHIAYEPFKSEYSDFPWENNPRHYLAWCDGKTGFPLIDAAMNQLNQTGYMHNRLRMLVASFLTKHLLTDYHLGEDYFAAKLLDFDLAANNGGWQWSASTGCDSQPYFRIFNPVKQSEKFDSEARFIKKYLPIFKNVPAQYLHEPWNYESQLKDFGIELGKNYPRPIIDHMERRKYALAVFEENFRLEKLAS
jgi:deoxyribodipyrimidine photo-lyase